MPDQILKDRTQKFGRNATATSAVILVLAWVPGIDIEQFKPFGLEFTKESGSLLSVWCLLAVILIYYVVRFSVDLWVDFLEWNLSRKRMDAKWQRAQQGIRDAKNLQGAVEPTDQMLTNTLLRTTSIHRQQVIVLEVGLPGILFAAAVMTLWERIIPLWPLGAPPTQ